MAMPLWTEWFGKADERIPISDDLALGDAGRFSGTARSAIETGNDIGRHGKEVVKPPILTRKCTLHARGGWWSLRGRARDEETPRLQCKTLFSTRAISTFLPSVEDHLKRYSDVVAQLLCRLKAAAVVASVDFESAWVHTCRHVNDSSETHQIRTLGTCLSSARLSAENAHAPVSQCFSLTKILKTRSGIEFDSVSKTD